MGPGLGDQQLVVHAYLALDRGQLPDGYAALSRIWTRCRELLGVDRPITGLPSTLPASLPEAIGRAHPDGVLAALEEPDHYRQMIARRVQDTINFSMVFTNKKGATVRRRLGAASPPGWVEYDRWWNEMAEEATSAFLGVVRLYLATTTLAPAEVAAAVHSAVPAAASGRFWWERGQTRDQFALWEWSAEREPRAERRIAVVGRSDAVAPYSSSALSEWAWSDGHPALPPLARYFLYSARLRAEVRDWGDGAEVEELLQQASELIDGVGAAADIDHNQTLTTVRAALAAAAARARTRRLVLDHILAEMGNVLREPLRADRTLGQRLALVLRETEEELGAALRAAERVGRSPAPADEPAVASFDVNSINAGERLDKEAHLRPSADRNQTRPSAPSPALAAPPARPTSPGVPTPAAAPSANGHHQGGSPVLIRMGFGVDVVGYSQRSHPEMEAVQRRLAEMIGVVLADIGLRLADTDHQSQGDSVKVFLPHTLEVHKALPRLLTCWHHQLAHDNRRYEDRMRIRMSVGVGPIGVAALGFAGGTPVEIARLLDCDLIRKAVIDHPESDLVVLISDQLHRWAIADWQPGTAPADFRRVRVVAKDYDDDAWLWIPSPAPAPQP